ncbi:hypothetical protein V1358_16495 [Pseudoalteromonas sp. YIC-656]|uniref:tetratricopeptide repeat protein n=1 Tax=Pseudoalteromonas pernae TaxID=3118054 RepID=UPI003242EC76
MRFLVIVMCALIGACSSTEDNAVLVKLPPPALNHSLFQPIDIEPHTQLFSLDMKQQAAFYEYVQHAQKQGMRDDKIVYNFVESLLSDFRYDGATYTASESLQHEEGNCISLALLVQAYADLIDVDTSYQVITEEPVFAGQNDVVLLASHFRTKLFAPKVELPENTYALRAGTLVDYFPSSSGIVSGSASRDDLIAKYYSNHAAQALIDKDINTSFNYLNAALRFTPNSLELLNIAAVLHRRAGDNYTAKALYEYIIEQEPTHAIAISNYAVLAKIIGDEDLLFSLQSKLAALNPKDPFHLLQLARNSAQQGYYHKASSYILKAREIAPYLPQTHADMALLKYQQGHINKALSEMEVAIEKSGANEVRTRYQAKYQALQKLQSH